MLRVEIRFKGNIAEDWSEWFEGLTITHADDDTLLTGDIADQAVLYGLVAKLRDMGLSLISINSEPIVHDIQNRNNISAE